MNRDFELSEAGRRANLAYWAEVQRRQLIQSSKSNQLIKYCISSLVRENHLASLVKSRSVVFNSALCDND